jgi:hypothetical protein
MASAAHLSSNDKIKLGTKMTWKYKGNKGQPIAPACVGFEEGPTTLNHIYVVFLCIFIKDFFLDLDIIPS